jgi:hypothetical protein
VKEGDLMCKQKRNSSLFFEGVVGEAARFSIKKHESGYECFLDGKAVPAVMSQRLVVEEGIPHVVLKIAIREYSTDIVKISQA